MDVSEVKAANKQVRFRLSLPSSVVRYFTFFSVRLAWVKTIDDNDG